MKVLQYAFTSWNSYYVNHRHTKNSVVYTGTHDNTTLRAWVEEIQNDQRDFCRRYINSMNSDYGALTWDLIREAYRSVADLCIIPLQDYLVLGKEARINSPGMPDGNWQWRLRPHFLSQDLSRSIRDSRYVWNITTADPNFSWMALDPGYPAEAGRYRFSAEIRLPPVRCLTSRSGSITVIRTISSRSRKARRWSRRSGRRGGRKSN